MNDQHRVHPGGRLLAVLLSGLLATSAIAPYAKAQSTQPAATAPSAGPSDEDKLKARTFYNAGIAKLEAKDYAGALPEFQGANRTIPSPRAQEKIALCYDGMGDVLNALKAWELFIEQAKGMDNLAPEVVTARDRVKALTEAAMTIPMSVTFASNPTGAQIEFDGQVAPQRTPFVFKLTPGKHQAKVTLDGHEPLQQEIEVKAREEGQNLSFTLTALPAPEAPPATTPAPAPAPAKTADTSEASGTNLPAYITLGVAGASAVVGTVFGVIALGNKSDFNDNPTDKKADTTERNALIADMAFGVAITLGITGTVLLLTNTGASSPEKAAIDTRNKRTMQLTPFAGPTGGGAAATWRF